MQCPPNLPLSQCKERRSICPCRGPVPSCSKTNWLALAVRRDELSPPNAKSASLGEGTTPGALSPLWGALDTFRPFC